MTERARTSSLVLVNVWISAVVIAFVALRVAGAESVRAFIATLAR